MAISTAQAVVGNFATTSAATVAKAYGSAVTVGHLLVALVFWGSATQTCSVSGSLNGAFTPYAASLATNATFVARAQVFYLLAGSSGAETITATCSGSNTDRELVIYELAGAQATPDSGIGSNGNTTNPTTSITTIAQPGWIISYCAVQLGTLSVGAGYTSDLAQNGDLAEHKAYAATGANSIPYANATGSQWVITGAAFLDAVAGKAMVADPRRTHRNTSIRMRHAFYMSAAKRTWKSKDSGLLIPAYS